MADVKKCATCGRLFEPAWVRSAFRLFYAPRNCYACTAWTTTLPARSTPSPSEGDAPPCICGHPRRDHRNNLPIDSRTPCLLVVDGRYCSCTKFRPAAPSEGDATDALFDEAERRHPGALDAVLEQVDAEIVRRAGGEIPPTPPTDWLTLRCPACHTSNDFAMSAPPPYRCGKCNLAIPALPEYAPAVVPSQDAAPDWSQDRNVDLRGEPQGHACDECHREHNTKVAADA